MLNNTPPLNNEFILAVLLEFCYYSPPVPDSVGLIEFALRL